MTEETIVGVTVGQFDALHLGHQALFQVLDEELSKRVVVRGAPPPGGERWQHRPSFKVLLTFSPSPRRVLAGVSRRELVSHPELWSVTSFRNRVEVARNAGFDLLFIARFNAKFLKLSPERFIRDYLVFGLNTRVLVVGQDWAFGHNRKGDVELLREIAMNSWFDVRVVDSVVIDGVRVSTTAIREALLRGSVGPVRALLGRPFSLSGRVRRGVGRGRQLGFPTANLYPFAQVLPANGVYAARAVVDGISYPAATNVGVQPTFGGTERTVEAHLLPDPVAGARVPEDLYGKRVTIEFYERLREERRFTSAIELQSAITQDIAQTKVIYARERGGIEGGSGGRE